MFQKFLLRDVIWVSSISVIRYPGIIQYRIGKGSTDEKVDKVLIAFDELFSLSLMHPSQNHPRDIRTPAWSRMRHEQTIGATRARENQKMRLTGELRYQVDADDSESSVGTAAFTVRLSFANDPTHWQTTRDVLQAATRALPLHLPAPDPSCRVQHATIVFGVTTSRSPHRRCPTHDAGTLISYRSFARSHFRSRSSARDSALILDHAIAKARDRQSIISRRLITGVSFDRWTFASDPAAARWTTMTTILPAATMVRAALRASRTTRRPLTPSTRVRSTNRRVYLPVVYVHSARSRGGCPNVVA